MKDLNGKPICLPRPALSSFYNSIVDDIDKLGKTTIMDHLLVKKAVRADGGVDTRNESSWREYSWAGRCERHEENNLETSCISTFFTGRPCLGKCSKHTIGQRTKVCELIILHM